MTGIVKVKGIVTKKINVNESNLLVTVFTKEFGKIEAISYGIRKSNRREKNSLNVLSVSNFIFHVKNQNYTVNTSELLHTYKSIITNIEKLETVYYLLDCINKIYYIDEEINLFYDKFIEIFEYVENFDDYTSLTKFYVIFNFLILIKKEHGIFDNSEFDSFIKGEHRELYLKLLKSKRKEFYEFGFDEIYKIIIDIENFINYNMNIKLDVKKIVISEDSKWKI